MIINEKYKIESDEMNIMLMERFIKKDGSEDFKCVGFYSDVKAALRGFAKREIQCDGLKDYESIVNKIDELYEVINNLNI